MIPVVEHHSHVQHELLGEPHQSVLPTQNVVAVGMPVGTVRDPLLPSPTMSIRCGGNFHPVTRTSFALWCAGRSPMPVETVRAEGINHTGAPCAEVNTELDELIQAGLLRSWSSTSSGNRELLRSLRIIPTGVGLGSVPHDPEQFRIARDLELDNGGGIAFVGGIMYSVWAASDGACYLDEAVNAVVASLGINEDDVWQNIGNDIPGILEIRACYLEVRPNG